MVALLDSDSIQDFKLEQLASVFRCHTAVIDPKGNSACVLQTSPCMFITEVSSPHIFSSSYFLHEISYT